MVRANANVAPTADAWAQTTAGEGITVRHGQGKAARITQLETEVVGITGLTTYDQ